MKLRFEKCPSLAVCYAMAFILVGCAATGPEPSGESVVWTPALIVSSVVYVNVDIGEQEPILGMIDTGATLCAIDASLAESLGLEVVETTEVLGTAGVTRSDVVELPGVSLGGHSVDGVRATTLDLSHIVTDGDQPLGMIIGFNVLERFALEIDFERSRVAFRDQPSGGLCSIAIDATGGIPEFEATLNGDVPIRFRIDSGASFPPDERVFLNITEHAWDRLREADASLEPEMHFSATGIGGTVRLPVAQIDGASLGPIELNGPHVIVQPRQGVFVEDDAPGFIGLYVLAPFGRIVIDYLDGSLDLPEAACAASENH